MSLKLFIGGGYYDSSFILAAPVGPLLSDFDFPFCFYI
jgi:hypothetical protein